MVRDRARSRIQAFRLQIQCSFHLIAGASSTTRLASLFDVLGALHNVEMSRFTSGTQQVSTGVLVMELQMDL